MQLNHQRRRFCATLCRTASVMTATSAFAACGGRGLTDPSPPPVAGPPAPAPLPPVEPPVEYPRPPVSPTTTALPFVTASSVSGGVTIAVGEGSPLALPWGAARTQVTRDGIVRVVLLVRAGDLAINAVSGVCTHEGCVVAGIATPVFVCPCHGSRYDHTGAVVQGPAPAALPRFATEFSGGLLTVWM